jgi:hypothetical protein
MADRPRFIPPPLEIEGVVCTCGTLCPRCFAEYLGSDRARLEEDAPTPPKERCAYWTWGSGSSCTDNALTTVRRVE